MRFSAYSSHATNVFPFFSTINFLSLLINELKLHDNEKRQPRRVNKYMIFTTATIYFYKWDATHNGWELSCLCSRTWINQCCLWKKQTCSMKWKISLCGSFEKQITWASISCNFCMIGRTNCLITPHGYQIAKISCDKKWKKKLRSAFVESSSETENFKSFLLDANDAARHAPWWNSRGTFSLSERKCKHSTGRKERKIFGESLQHHSEKFHTPNWIRITMILNH